MAYAPYSFNNVFSGSGGSPVNLPWPFLDRTHVKVYFDGVLKTNGVDYNFLSDSQIKLLTAAYGAIVKITRATPAEPLVTFVAGSVIPIQDLNTAMLQGLYRSEELVIESTTSVAYADLVGVPTTFPPATHTHDAAAVATGVLAPDRLGSGTRDGTKYLRDDGTWQIPPSASGTWGAISGQMTDQADLQAALDAKAPNGHVHTIAAVTGLQAALDAKLNASQASSLGLSVLGASSANNARNTVGIYVQSTDPGSVPAGSLWIY